MMKWIYLALALTACTVKTEPLVVSPEPPLHSLYTCSTACSRLNALKCPAGLPIEGRTCEAVCTGSPLERVVACVSLARTCQEADDC
jgi:hypothetical protein